MDELPVDRANGYVDYLSAPPPEPEVWCTCEPLWTGEAPAVPDRHCPVHGEGT